MKQPVETRLGVRSRRTGGNSSPSNAKNHLVLNEGISANNGFLRGNLNVEIDVGSEWTRTDGGEAGASHIGATFDDGVLDAIRNHQPIILDENLLEIL